MFALYSLCSFALADCSWQEASTWGYLAGQLITESSGISQSLLDKNRLYHVNDSGSKALFYVSGLRGENLEEVRISGFDARDADMEDTDVGPCGTSSCLFIGDIGDNRQNRSSIHVILIKEKPVFPEAVLPYKTVTLRYPDGANNAEGLAVHPNGDIYIMTKPALSLSAADAKLYRLSKLRWQSAGERSLTLDLIGFLDLRALSGATLDVASHTVTALDISQDGKKLLILSYGNAFEIDLDLDTLTDDLPSKIDTRYRFRQIDLVRLAQQESVSYLGASRIVYTTEARSLEVPLMMLECF